MKAGGIMPAWARGAVAFVLLAAAAAARGWAAVPGNLPSVEIEGTLEVVIADDFAARRHEMFYSVVEKTSGLKFRLTFPGPPPAGARTGMRVRAKGRVEGVDLAVAEDPAAADASGRAAFTVLESPPVLAVDTHTALVILLNFTDEDVSCSRASVSNLMFSTTSDSVKDFYNEASYGGITFSGKAVGPYDVNFSTGNSGSRDEQSAAGNAKARADGYEPNDYDHVVYVLPSGSAGSAGLAEVGGRRVWLKMCGTMIVYAHELGHNLGMLHSSTDTDNDGAVDDEYGDYTCVMGNEHMAHPNAMWKRNRGWTPAANEKKITTTGTYQLAPLEDAPADTDYLQSLRLDISGSSQDYYLSYRLRRGYDNSLHDSLVYVHRWSGSGNTLLVRSIDAGGTFNRLTADGFSATVNSLSSARATIAITIPDVPGIRQWNDAGDHLWNNSARWSNDDIPDGTNEKAKFSNSSGSDVTTATTVNGIARTLYSVGLNGISPTIGQLSLYDNAAGSDGWRLYCGSGTNTLTVNGEEGDSESPVILNTYGVHSIAGTASGVLKLKLGRTGQNIIQVNNTLEIDAVINGSGTESGLTKTGDGTLVLAANNNFAGDINILDGVLKITQAAALGDGPKTIKITNGTNDVAQLRLDGSGGNISLGTGFVFKTSSASMGNTTIRNQAGTNTLSGALDMIAGGGNTMVTVGDGRLTLNGGISASGVGGRILILDAGDGTLGGTVGGVIADGTTVASLAVRQGTWTLTAANTYSGATTISNGTLTLSGGANRIKSGNNIVVLGALDLNGTSQTFDSLSGSGDILTGGGTLTVGSGGASSTFGGVISDGGGLTKSGAGTLTLAGANTYSGPTAVNAGTLLVNGSLAAGSAVTVAGATLGGTGTIKGRVTIGSGGTLAPGTSAGTLRIEGSLGLNSGAVSRYELGTRSDRVEVGGNLVLDGVLNITDAGGFAPGTYALFTYGGALTNNGLNIGAAPSGYVCTIRTDTPGEVNLAVTRTNANAPTISHLGDLAIDEDTVADPIPFTIGDVETAASSLTMSKASSNPTLVPTNRIVFGGSGSNRTVTITPAADQHGVATITLTVSDETLTDSDSFVLSVRAVNDPPVLAAISNRALGAGQTLTITHDASDIDLPAQALAFSLLAHPTGATLGAASGLLAWRPAVSQANSTNLFRVQVADDGVPSLAATQQFAVVVRPLAAVVITEAALTNDRIRLTVAGDAGPDYAVEASADFGPWSPLFATNPAAMPFRWTDPAATNILGRFYRVLIGP